METPKKIGRYEIIAELGHGAMGTVYRAKDPAMDRDVAVKTVIALALASHQSDDFRERFFREARAAGGLNHPGIVTVFDVGEHEGLPYLVMEFVDGFTLADAVKKGERLAIERICEIGQRIAEALAYAHQRGVVHRDIKPANILLTTASSHGVERPKITDFGVAKLALGQTTVTGQLLGTPAFMPPEQFTGAPVDGRADIFSLGVILYWLATGEQPFPGESITAVSYKVVHTEPVPPQKLNPAVPAKLNDVILKCLAKSAANRYQSGDQLARDLGEIRNGHHENVSLNPVGPADPFDPDSTLIDYRPASGMSAGLPSDAAATTAHSPGSPPTESKTQRSSGSRFVAPLLVILLIISAGAWYATRYGRGIASAVLPAVHEVQPDNSSTPKAPKRVAKLSASKAADGTAEKNPLHNPIAHVALPETPAVPISITPPLSFDPKALDAKQNARLHIDDKHFPEQLGYTIEMNGSVYFQKNPGDPTKAEDQKLFVPPGVQEFRVTASSGDVQKASNTVSAEFKAKKKLSLKIDLRTQGAPDNAPMPNALYPNGQIFVGLK